MDRSSIMKSIAEFDVDLPRVIEVESSKRQAVIKQYTAIRYIQSVQRDPVFLAEAFSQRNVERRMLG